MTHKKGVVLALLVILISIALWLGGITDYINIEQLKLHRAYLQHLVQEHYLFSVMIYITLYIIATALLLPMAAVLTLAGGFLFGILIGAIYANIGATIGATFAFLLVRYSFGSWLQERYAEQLAHFNKRVQEDGASYLLAIHLLPITPLFVANLLAGMTNVSLWTFIWTTSVGIFPGELVYTIAGQQLSRIEQLSDIFSGSILLLFLLLAVLAFLPVAIKWCWQKRHK